MGMMKSHLAALEALVELRHQRSAASPDILAYSERLQFLISQDILTLCSSVKEREETQVTVALRKERKRREGIRVRGTKGQWKKTL